MANSIATDEVEIARRLADGVVELEENFGVGVGAVMEVPAGGGHSFFHFEAPPTEKIIGGVVVFDEVEAPVLIEAEGGVDALECLGEGWVVITIAALACAQGDEFCGFGLIVSEERSGPEAWFHAEFFDLCCYDGHVAELVVWRLEVDAFPTVVDHGEWKVARCRCQLCHGLCAVEDELF